MELSLVHVLEGAGLTTPWRPDRPARPLGCGAYILIAGLIVGSLVLLILVFPVRCPRKCGPCDQLIGYTKRPGVTQDQADQMLAYWLRENCEVCGGRRRVTVLEAYLRSSSCCY